MQCAVQCVMTLGRSHAGVSQHLYSLLVLHAGIASTVLITAGATRAKTMPPASACWTVTSVHAPMDLLDVTAS